MSRIGNLPIVIPEDVKVEYKNGTLVVEGPKGKLEHEFNFDIEVRIDGNTIKLKNKKNDMRSIAFYGLTRSLMNNMVLGVHTGFTKTLKIAGVGYKAQVQGNNLILNIGFSHQVTYQIPDGIEINVPDPNTIVVKGIDKQLVGQVAANIRKFKKPEPYKGKGIMYLDERIRRKAGKSGVK